MIYKCKNCGSNTLYHAEKELLVCPNCLGEDTGEAAEAGGMTECVMCGAELAAGDYSSALKCGHCGTWQILTERTAGNYEPHLVIPFHIGKEKATEILREEFKSRMFTPRDFLSESSLEHLQGSYVPFWLFDYDGQCSYEGFGTKVRTWRTGDTEYTETSKYRVVRELAMDFERIPADASFAMEDGVMDLMEPYQYRELRGFCPQFLSGFNAEIYNDESDQFEARARGKARDAAEECLNGTITGYAAVSTVKKDMNISLRDTNYALFPVWVYTYRFKGKEYRFYVNGQTGKVVGKSPVAMESIVAAGISFFALAALTAGLLIRFLEVL